MAGIIEKAWRTIQQHRMLPARGVIVLGVSGGPDSLALMHVIDAVGTRFCSAEKLDVHVGHLHHGMRGLIADDDAAFVEAQSKALNWSCTIAEADVPGLARARGVGEEVAGRDARYDFLERLAVEKGATRIFMGHHSDDQAETVLMRLMRGAGPRGMGGIPYVRPLAGNEGILVARPLMDCTRSEIEEFLAERGLKGRLDSTNLSDRYLRNRVRRRLLPAFAGEWGGERCTREDLCRFAAACQRLNAITQSQCASLISELGISLQPGWIEVPVEKLRLFPHAFRSEFLRNLLERANLAPRMLGREDLACLVQMADMDRGAISLPGAVNAEVFCGSLCLYSPSGQDNEKFDLELSIPGVTQMSSIHAEISSEIVPNREGLLEEKIARNDSDEALLDYDRLQLPLRIRSRQDGDRMRPLGAPGVRKLKDLFNDLRIPRPKRRRIPLVVDATGEILWVAGYRIAHHAAIGRDTKSILRLRLKQR